ncbi:HK97-gp10 family putative phage morphogenesis protein [Bordetella genomosp. 4]|uniref:Uncharacterized protein n=1 Tax=Bordetella genomosp. 4 TaxID=463044 RepID=A0A261URU1_9BORD|nr:HK97-gp10 family putative phage morphogenesis protein [Bordetella genomosp. 4]OZI64616.1 hypothetical protein CAL20_02895 [Bordetella genomosp. 4]
MAENRFSGLDQALKNMKDLPVKIRRSAARKAVGKGAAILRRRAKENALRIDDKDTGRRIADNVGQRYRSKESRRTGDVIISVGVLTKRGRIPRGNPDEGPKGNTPHWHLKELGTSKVRAEPFIRPAGEGSVDEVLNAVAAELDKQVTNEVKKLGV